jgi:uncharacterized protein (TIGR03437 family)
MNSLRGLFLCITIAAISSFGGTVQQLPALPDGAVAQALQVDAAGNIYAAGSLPPKSPTSAADTTDAFVAKLTPDGSKVVYFAVLTGSGADAATALAVGPDDSAYVTGTTSSTNFPVTPGALQTKYGVQNTKSSDTQTFVVKLDPSGAIVYSTYIGGRAVTNGLGIVTDSAGDAFVLGTGAPTGVAPIAGGDPTTLGGYVIKLNPAGSKILMAFTGLGGAHLTIDSQGDVYLAGMSPQPATTPPFTPGAFQARQADRECGGDAFFEIPCSYEYVAKADPTGTKLIYLTGLNGTYGAIPAGIAADASGNAIIGGTTNSPDFPVSSDAFETLYAPVISSPTIVSTIKGPGYIAPPATGFIAKLNDTGSALIWSTFFGGSVTDSISSMNVDSDGDIIFAGLAGSSDLPGLSDAPAGCRPSLIQKLSFAARLAPDGTSASPAQLFYGAPAYSYGPYSFSNPTGPIAIAGSTSGAITGLAQTGTITAADLFAPSRLACVTDPADNVQLLSVAPGQDLSLFGTMLAPSAEAPPGGTATSFDGVHVTFNGIAAPILYTSDDQVNVQVPIEIAGRTPVQIKVTNTTTAVPLDETRTIAVAPQQPSVFLTAEALAGAQPSCSGSDGVAPTAVALNADGSLNSASNPAAAGSIITIFLNGVAPGTALTGLANDNPVTFTSSAVAHSNGGVVPVSFRVPPSYTNGVSLTKLKAGGATVRERFVAVCVIATPSNQAK